MVLLSWRESYVRVSTEAKKVMDCTDEELVRALQQSSSGFTAGLVNKEQGYREGYAQAVKDERLYGAKDYGR